MNIEKVNATLLRATDHIRSQEISSLHEAYTGHGGSLDAGIYDNSPSGDPFEGGDGGVDNMASSVEAFDSYIEQTAGSIAARGKISIDSALDVLVTVADEMAENGELPVMPDPDDASDEDLSAWAGAAKASGLVGRCIQFLNNQGDPTQGVANDV